MTVRTASRRLVAVAGALRPLDVMYLAAIVCGFVAGHGTQLLLVVPVAAGAAARIWIRGNRLIHAPATIRRSVAQQPAAVRVVPVA